MYDGAVIKEEKALIKKYGLKNRREVWKADYAISKIRGIAKNLITASDKEKSEFVERQREKGFKVENIAGILGLSKEDYLKRRLQTILASRGLAKTHTQARQFIVHKHVAIDGKIINSPAHLTTLKEENAISLNLTLEETKKLTNEEKEFLEKVKKSKSGGEE